jgi:hypothetical protein
MIATVLLAVSSGFLLAVLWMDLMYDVQVLKHDRSADLSEAVLASIAGYYRRVTTEARPMSHLVGAMMMVALATLVTRLASGALALSPGVVSLALIAVPVALGLFRVVPNAVRLGRRADPAPAQSRLARAICRDHLICFASVLAFVLLQLIGGSSR